MVIHFMKKNTVLFIGNEKLVSKDFVDIIDEHFEPLFSHSMEETIDRLAIYENEISVVVIDLDNISPYGLDILKQLVPKIEHYSLPFIAISKEHKYEIGCLDLGASEFIDLNNIKPQVVIKRINKVITSNPQVSSANHNNAYMRIAAALSDEYFVIYYVNLETGRFIEYSSNGGYETLGVETEGEDFFATSKRNILQVIYPEDCVYMLKNFTRENIISTLEKEGKFHLSYRLLVNDQVMHVRLKATRLGGNKNDYLVIGVTNVLSSALILDKKIENSEN